MGDHDLPAKLLFDIVVWIFNPELSGWVVAIGIGAGITMALAPQIRNIRLAHFFFLVAWIWAGGCTIGEIGLAKLSLAYAIPAVFVGCGVIGTLSLITYRWVEQNHQEGAVSLPSKYPAPPPVPAPSLIVPSITWANPEPITSGSQLSDKQLNAKFSVDGNPDYNPSFGYVLPPGRHPLTVTFSPADTKNYSSVTKTVHIVVNPAPRLSPASDPTAPLLQPHIGYFMTSEDLGNHDYAQRGQMVVIADVNVSNAGAPGTVFDLSLEVIVNGKTLPGLAFGNTIRPQDRVSFSDSRGEGHFLSGEKYWSNSVAINAIPTNGSHGAWLLAVFNTTKDEVYSDSAFLTVYCTDARGRKTADKYPFGKVDVPFTPQ